MPGEENEARIAALAEIASHITDRAYAGTICNACCCRHEAYRCKLGKLQYTARVSGGYSYEASCSRSSSKRVTVLIYTGKCAW